MMATPSNTPLHLNNASLGINFYHMGLWGYSTTSLRGLLRVCTSTTKILGSVMRGPVLWLRQTTYMPLAVTTGRPLSNVSKCSQTSAIQDLLSSPQFPGGSMFRGPLHELLFNSLVEYEVPSMSPGAKSQNGSEQIRTCSSEGSVCFYKEQCLTRHLPANCHHASAIMVTGHTELTFHTQMASWYKTHSHVQITLKLQTTGNKSQNPEDLPELPLNAHI